ncbi:MAG: CoA pyrophosphatase, partial [Gammaproteobacteria bacterium]|nr:CoA pyrophosphatase [Gammaproteobacteria bacterium]
ASPRHAAERETMEEIGLDMSQTKHLGQLNDKNGRSAGKPVGLIISCFVYQLQHAVDLQLNYEVQSALWIPFSRLLDPGHTFEYKRADIPERSFSGIRLSDNEQHVLWGLTHRFLTDFFDILQTPLPQVASGPRQIRSK